jgi:hypothetical protein
MKYSRLISSAAMSRLFVNFQFCGKLRQHNELRLLKVRGFRVISGGLLRPLENFRWWWKLNRRIGDLIPASYIEIQAIMKKMPAAP